MESISVAAVGPGLGRSAGSDELICSLYQTTTAPLILDDEAWAALNERSGVLEQPAGPRIFTLSLNFWHRESGGTVMLDRIAVRGLARQAAAQWRATLVIKGAGTFVTDGARSYLNNSGNAGMATSGCGDVLTGVLAGLICQGLTPYDAARLATYLHGRAGDAAVEELGQLALIATDLLEFLPPVLKQVIRNS
jgi:hydroxyethylthiazole kinase-like uncharacterized protein yjeF